MEEERDLVRPCAPLNASINSEDWCTDSIISYAKYNDNVCSITASDDTLYDKAQNMEVNLVASTLSKSLQHEINLSHASKHISRRHERKYLK